ncbi:hypothetical protein FF38_13060 [Lucilia cuprina]|uniref:DUF4806 domain-containing protein n=1 Tax=Lucilia cuprina TaxID=7375 RepID=A0A0L0BMW0_LUCCU|nr:hypothetical protein FF38_13060 [Lucilia cuprina]
MSKQKKLKLNETTDGILADILSKVTNIQEEVKEIKAHNIQNKSESTSQNHLIDKIVNQNVGKILAEQTVALKSTITSLWDNPKHLERFPIETNDALQDWENYINDENKSRMIHAVKIIVGKSGLRKNLKLVLSPNLIINYNLHGSHTKKRLYNYSKIMDVFLHATVNPNDLHTFEDDMRKAIKDIKNCHFKNASLKRKNATSTENN